MDSKGTAPVPTIVVEDTANGGKKLTARDYGSNPLSAADSTTPQAPDSARSVASTAVPATAVPPPEDEGEGADGVPGALSAKQEPEIPEWFKVGWRQVSGIDDPAPSTEARGKAALNLFLKEQFYGDWYHNAGVIIFVRSPLSTRTIQT
jgi:hypothetical protein